MTGQLLTAEQLADRWQVKPAHVYRLTRDGEIPAVRLGKYYRYRLDQIEAFEVSGSMLNQHAENGSAAPVTPRARPKGARSL